MKPHMTVIVGTGPKGKPGALVKATHPSHVVNLEAGQIRIFPLDAGDSIRVDRPNRDLSVKVENSLSVPLAWEERDREGVVLDGVLDHGHKHLVGYGSRWAATI